MQSFHEKSGSSGQAAAANAVTALALAFSNDRLTTKTSGPRKCKFLL